jgi:D-alanyl-D-alanine dipeptidase
MSSGTKKGNRMKPPETTLVNLKDVDHSWIIDAAYSKADTFLQQAIYPKNELYLIQDVAIRLHRVEIHLRAKGLGLKILDAYRPLSLQRKMWNRIQDDRYVANPATGSRHNRGCAVDVTLVNANNEEIEMPTPYLDFSEKSHRDYCDAPVELIQNRETLEHAMKHEGFIPLHEEWWHFDDPDWENYPVMDINPYETPYLGLD